MKITKFSIVILYFVESFEIIFFASDEAYFHLNGAVNNHNCRVWSDSGPDFVLEQSKHPEKILVWCAVSSKKVIGPYFFDASVKHDNYLKMLTDFFWPRYYKSKNVNSFYFQQDGAPAHKHKEVQQWLTAKLGPKFLDKTMWPPRSPDLNPCDYFLWGYLKDKVYAKIPQTLLDLKGLIESELKSVNSIMLDRVFRNMRERCEAVLKSDGGHIE